MFTTAVISYLRLVLLLTTLIFLLVLLFCALIKVREVYSYRFIVSTISTIIDAASSIRLVVITLLTLVEVAVSLLVL